MPSKAQIKKLEKTFPVPKCGTCRNWGTVVILSYVTELDTPPFDHIRHPDSCPKCGRKVTKVILDYGPDADAV